MLRGRSSLALIAIIAVACTLSLSALGYEYVYDDKASIVANPRLRDLSGVARAFGEHLWAFDPTKAEGHYYRPLLVAWLALGHHLFGGSPAGHHALSLGLHLGATALVHRLGQLLRLTPLACLFAAAVFALHPLQIQAFTWASAANDPLMAVLLLSSTICWITQRRLGAVALFLCATLVIERALPFALVPALYALTLDEPAGGMRLRSTLRALGSFAVSAAVILVVRARVLGPSPGQGPGFLRTLSSLPPVLARYAVNIAFPGRLSIAYPETLRPIGVGSIVLSVALIGAAAAFVALRVRDRRRLFLVGAAAILFAAPLQVALLPGYAVVQDRYLYLPLSFAALLVSDLVFPEGAESRLRLGLCALWLFVLMVLHPRNHGIWRNDLALYERAAEVAPNNALFLMNYANARKRSGVDDGCTLLLRARDAAIAAPQTADLPLVHYNVGNCLREHGRAREAILAYDQALATARGYFTSAAQNRVVALLDAGELDEAARAVADVTMRSSQTAGAWKLAGIVAARRRMFADAVAFFERGKALAPNDRSFDALIASAKNDAK